MIGRRQPAVAPLTSITYALVYVIDYIIFSEHVDAVPTYAGVEQAVAPLIHLKYQIQEEMRNNKVQNYDYFNLSYATSTIF